VVIEVNDEFFWDFKMAEFGPLPKDWQVIRLKEVVALERGVSWSKSDEATSGIGVLSIPNIREDGRLDLTPRVRILKRIPPEKWITQGDVLLVGSSGSIQNVGRVGMVSYDISEPLTYASFTVRARVNDSRMDQTFLLYLLRSPWVKFSTFSKRAADGKYNLQVQQLRNHLVPIPPLSEQRAIAHVLRTVQRAKEATERVIQATQELKKSLMYYLFTYGSVPIEEAEKVPLKETEIGLVPEHWEVVRLGEVCLKPQYGFTESATNQRVGPKFLRITDIQNSQVNWNTVPYCEISDELLKRYRLEPGDLLFARIGATTGKTLLIRECPEAIFASYLIRVRVNLNFLLPEFLFYFTQGNLYWSQINTAKGGRLKQGINIPVLSSLLVPLPPISEQRIIARILEAVDKKLQVEEARKQVLDALFNSLLHNLMTAKIRVKDLNLYNIDIIQRR
jgi:type I restriction enzyme S subunit